MLLCLILSCKGDSKPEGDARRLVATSNYRWGTEDDLIRSLSSSEELEASRNEKRQLDDDDIFNALSDLISVEMKNEDRDRLSELINTGGKKLKLKMKIKYIRLNMFQIQAGYVHWLMHTGTKENNYPGVEDRNLGNQAGNSNPDVEDKNLENRSRSKKVARLQDMRLPPERSATLRLTLSVRM